MHGQYILIFVKTEWILLQQATIRATASIDTLQQQMDITYENVTDLYPRTQPMPIIANRDFRATIESAKKHIEDSAISDCNITITQVDNIWDVRCEALENHSQKCHFVIDNGRVKDIEY
jgi:nitrogen regulatory protein PII